LRKRYKHTCLTELSARSEVDDSFNQSYKQNTADLLTTLSHNNTQANTDAGRHSAQGERIRNQ